MNFIEPIDHRYDSFFWNRRITVLLALILATLAPAGRAWAVCSGGQLGGFTQYLAGQLPDIVLTSGVATTKYVIPHYVYFKGTSGHCGILARSTVPGTTITDTYGCSGTGCTTHPTGEYAAVSNAYGGSFTAVVTATNVDGSNYVKLGFDGSAQPGTEGVLELAFATSDLGEATPPIVFARVPIYVVSAAAPASAWGRILSSAATVSGNRLVLSHPYLDGRPLARLFAAHVYNPGGGLQGRAWNHPIAVAYDAALGRWTIVNTDGAAMSVGLAFNYRIDPTATQVCVPPPGTGDEFRSSVTLDDIGANDNRLATIVVMPVDGPPHPVAVKYDGSRWSIVYADRSLMPGGACFNVRVIPFSQYLEASAQSDLSGKQGTTVDVGVGVALSDSGSQGASGGTRLFWFGWAAGNSALPMVYTTNLTPLGFREPANPDTAVSSLAVTRPCVVVGCISQRWGLRHDDGTAVPWTQRTNVWAEYESSYPPPRRRPPIGPIKLPIEKSKQ